VESVILEAKRKGEAFRKEGALRYPPIFGRRVTAQTY